MRNKVPKKKTGNIIKSYKCNQCDYASSRMEHLRTHLKTHSGEKPNKCSQCEYALGEVSKTPVTEIVREGGGVPPLSVNFFPLGFLEPTVREGGGGVPPLSVNFFPLGFLEPAVREGGGGSTPPFR